MPPLFALLLITLACSFMLIPTTALASICEKIDPYDGVTWDYFDDANHRPTNAYRQGHVKLVENVHLTQKMNNLDRGNTGSGIVGFLLDIDYTLRRIPNHPKALDMISRFQLNHNGKIQQLKNWQGSWPRSAECYFDRAFQLTPTEPTLRMLYGIHLHRTKKYDEAINEYKYALWKQKDSSEIHYNLGLSYFELENNEKALFHAQKAYELNYPLEGLKNKLKSKKLWK